MSGLSTMFWLIATGVVVLLLVGTWMAVRVLRARRPAPGIEHRNDTTPGR